MRMVTVFQVVDQGSDAIRFESIFQAESENFARTIYRETGRLPDIITFQREAIEFPFKDVVSTKKGERNFDSAWKAHVEKHRAKNRGTHALADGLSIPG